MREYTKFQKKYRWPDIETALKTRIGETDTVRVMNEAARLISQYEKNYQGLKGFEKTHAAAAYHIAAVYIPVKEAIGSEEAILMLDTIWKPEALETNAKYNKLPPKLFISICRIVAKTAFGNKAGFDRKDISKDKTEVRFDIYSCPYARIMKELGCSEACPVICRQDEYTYGNMKGIVFERTKTLGRGDDRCDFCYRLK